MEILLRITEEGEITVADEPTTTIESAADSPRPGEAAADEAGLPDVGAYEAVAPPLAFRPEGDPEDPTVDAVAPPRRFSAGR